MPLGALPQLCVMVSGKHRPAVMTDLTSMVVERGGSVTASKKIMSCGQFMGMISVWLPPRRITGMGISPDHFKAIMIEGGNSGEEPRLQGYHTRVVDLTEEEAANEHAGLPALKSERRLRVEGPQKPGMLNSLTQVIVDFDCVILDLNSTTIPSFVKEEVTLRVEMQFGLPEQLLNHVPDLEQKLHSWATKYDAVLRMDEPKLQQVGWS